MAWILFELLNIVFGLNILFGKYPRNRFCTTKYDEITGIFESYLVFFEIFFKPWLSFARIRFILSRKLNAPFTV